MEKVCNVCVKLLPIELFNKHPSTADKRQNQCRPCRNKLQVEYRKHRGGNIKTYIYEKTEKGFLVRLYRNMKSRIEGVQKSKFYLYEGKELLSKESFYDWAINNQDFKRLFNIYKENKFNRKLAPSVDRINSNIGYVLTNMRFITHSENSGRSWENRNKRIHNGKVL